MDQKNTYKLTGWVVLILGILFFLRDIGINWIGETSGWTIVIVLMGVALLVGEVSFSTAQAQAKGKKSK